MIEASGLSRVYGSMRTMFGRDRGGTTVTALDDFTLDVPSGETHGLLGPNGAGKTTLVKLLSTVLLPTAGRASVAGFDVVRQAGQVRKVVGLALGGDRGMYGRLSARQNLCFWGTLAGLDRATARTRTDILLERVGLTDRADERVEAFSRGMKQRMHLARGLIGDPSVLILDEPTVGMDPVSAREVRSLIAELRTEHRTILLTTHDMREAEEVCDRVSLIDHGRLLFTEEPQRIGRLLSGHDQVEFRAVDADLGRRLRCELATLAGVVTVEPIDGDAGIAGLTWRVHVAGEGVRAVLNLLVSHGVTDLATKKPSLEQVYLHFVGDRGLRV